MSSRQTPLEEVIFYVIDQTTKKQKHYSQRKLDELGAGVTVDQWVLIKTVDQFQPISQTELAQKAVKDNASITRTLDILEKKNLLIRSADPSDRRKYLIELSKEGSDFVARYMDTITDLRKQGTKGFTTKELESLRSMLLRIQENVS